MKPFILSILLFSSQFILAQVHQLTINVDLSAQTVDPNGVFIVGNFSDNNYDGNIENAGYENWMPGTLQLQDVDQDNIYSITLSLVEGIYEYKIINGNDWPNLETVPEACQVSVGMNTNRYVNLNGDVDVSFCYGECAPCGDRTVRFRVNMNNEANVDPVGLFVTGDFQGWQVNDTPMNDLDGDGIWERYVNVGTANQIHFGFYNGLDWLGGENSSLGLCTDAGSRFADITGTNTVLPAYCFNSCEECFSPVSVSFTVNMSNVEINPIGVHLAGSFNGWNPADPAWLMTDEDGDSIYVLTQSIFPGTYEYKTVNGNDWTGNGNSNEVIPSECSVNGNRQLILGTSDMSVAYCYGECINDCVALPAAAPVTFSVNMNLEEGLFEQVWLQGDFTNPVGSNGAILMQDNDSDGVYEVTVEIGGEATILYTFLTGFNITGPDFYQEGIGLSQCGVPSGVQDIYRRTHVRTGQPEILPMAFFNSCVEYSCIDVTACNYCSTCTVDDGSCFYPGCTDETACNYDPAAGCDDGSCQIAGCMNQESCNYNEYAVCDDGSCVTGGCMDAQACNYDPNVTCNNGTCIYPGCQDPTACNYDDVAICDDGSCLYNCNDPLAYNFSQCCLSGSPCQYDNPELGCTDPGACNFNPNAIFNASTNVCDYSCSGCTDPNSSDYQPNACLDDGSCGYSITGIAFHDLNLNGIWDNDLPLAGIAITIDELQMTVFTDENGVFQVNDLPFGEYSLHCDYDQNVWDVVTTSVDWIASIPGQSEAYFGFSSTQDFADLLFFSNTSGDYNCDGEVGQFFTIINSGNVPMDINLDITLDPNLTYSYAMSVQPDLVLPNSVHYTVENVQPNEAVYIEQVVFTPGFEFMGQILVSNCVATATVNGVVAASESQDLAALLTCAYDPNDKAAIPTGYTDAHYIQPDQNLEYKVRFQNTGNAPAQDVVVRDTISELLDINSFHFIASSFPCQVSIDGITREVVFAFYDIMLPDSVNNEPESHGFLKYAIDPIAGLNTNDLIENTAYIYFDSNPAVVTNSTWHTVFECTPDFAVIDGVATPAINQIFSISATAPLAESYTWYYEGNVIGMEQSIEYSFSSCGSHLVTLEANSPVCFSQHIYDVVIPYPIAAISQTGLTLSSVGGNYFQWYLNGVAIEGATQGSYTVQESGDYTVEVTNAFGCTDISDITAMIVGVSELNSSIISIAPIPMKESCMVSFSKEMGVCDLELFDGLGKLLRTYHHSTNSSLVIERGDLEDGMYFLKISGSVEMAGNHVLKIVIAN